MQFFQTPNGIRYALAEGIMVAINNGHGWLLQNSNVHNITLDEVIQAAKAVTFPV
jgi:hypothetical protein